MRPQIAVSVIAFLCACMPAAPPAPPPSAQVVDCGTLALEPASLSGSRIAVRARLVASHVEADADGSTRATHVWECNMGYGEERGALIMTSSTGAAGSTQMAGVTWTEDAEHSARTSFPREYLVTGVARDIRAHTFRNGDIAGLFIEDAHIEIDPEEGMNAPAAVDDPAAAPLDPNDPSLDPPPVQ